MVVGNLHLLWLRGRPQSIPFQAHRDEHSKHGCRGPGIEDWADNIHPRRNDGIRIEIIFNSKKEVPGVADKVEANSDDLITTGLEITREMWVSAYMGDAGYDIQGVEKKVG